MIGNTRSRGVGQRAVLFPEPVSLFRSRSDPVEPYDNFR